MEYDAKLVKGDHERYLRSIENNTDEGMLHPVIYATHKWLKKNLKSEYYDFVLNLSEDISIRLNDKYTLCACHASRQDMRSRTCAADVPVEILRQTYGGYPENIIAYGHHHESHVTRMDDKFLINCASVGMRKYDNISRYTVIEYDDENIETD